MLARGKGTKAALFRHFVGLPKPATVLAIHAIRERHLAIRLPLLLDP